MYGFLWGAHMINSIGFTLSLYANVLYSGSWVNCNDVRMSRCALEEVLQAQAYILFYTRRRGICSESDRHTNLEPPPNKRVKLK